MWSRVYDVPVVQRALYRPVQDAVLGELRRSPTRRILDVGCGTGILCERLARELDAEVVFGCDLSIGMVRQAATRSAGPWVQGDAQCLPLASGSVDVIVSTDSFHFFPDPDAALAEFHRVLAPGGRFLVGTVDLPNPAISRAVNAAHTAVGSPLRGTTRAELTDRVRRAGFGEVHHDRVVRIGGALPTLLTVATRDG